MSDENDVPKATQNVATEAPVQPKTQPVKQAEPVAGGMFGITTETKSSNIVLIPAPHKLTAPNPQYASGYYFPIATLVNVIFNPELEKKDGEKVPVIQFVFRDSEKRQFTHTEWVVDSTDAKFTLKLDSLNSRIKHIWENTMGVFPASGIGVTAKNWSEFFEQVATAFNTSTDGTKAYAKTQAFIKLVYYKADIRFPFAPNFLERINKEDPRCKILTVNPKYDEIEAKVSKTPNSIAGLAGGIPGVDSMPDFEQEYD